MSFLGGGRSRTPSTPSTTTQIVREAPGIEERKLELMDIARQVAQKPISLPSIQVAPLSQLEQQATRLAAQTGVGAGTTAQGIAQLQAAAFGGGREGVQQAELQNRILSNIGRARQQGFGTALQAAQNQQRTQAAVGQQLLGAGQLQQQMGQQDINQLMSAGGVQRQLAQAALDAQRQSTLQQQFEPFQRAEFLANLYAAGPKTQSGVTMGTAPTTSPLAQAVGTGIGAFTAFQNTK